MESQTWWKTGVAIVVVLLGLAVAFVFVPGGGSGVLATELAGPAAQVLPNIAGFAKYEGIDGEATDIAHLTWIDVLAIDWGANLSPRGASSKKGAAIVEDLTLKMEFDKASPKLQEASLKGEVIPKLVIDLTTEIGEDRATYLQLELTNAQVTSFQVSGSVEAGPPVAVVGHNFETIKVTYTEFKPDGKPGDVVQYTYDVQGRLIGK